MNCLLIDTSTSHLIVSMIKDNQILYKHDELCNVSLSSVFLNVVSDCFAKCNINPSDINKIFVSTGPGSFTGIRIGLTFAKIYSFMFKIDLIPFSTLELLSTSCNSSSCSFIDARRGYVYYGVYDENLDCIYKDSYDLLENVLLKTNEINDCEFYSYDNISNFLKPKVDIIKLVSKHINDIPINPHKLKPSYLKKTEAEEKLCD